MAHALSYPLSRGVSYGLRGAGAAVPALIPTPVDFGSVPASANFYLQSNGLYTTDFNIDAHRPATGKIYLVNPDRPDNSGDGLTWATAKRDLSVTALLSDWDTIILDDNGGAGRDYLGVRGWAGVTVTRGGYITTRNGSGKVRLLATASSTYSAWSLDAGNTYKITTTIANFRKVTDLSRPDSYGAYETLTVAADLATCRATPGTTFHDGTFGYVTAGDSRPLINDTSMIPTAGTNNARWSPTTSAELFIDPKIEFIGGARPFYALIQTAGIVPKLYLKGVHLQGSFSGNGMSWDGPGEYYSQDCFIGCNDSDGDNGHGNATYGYPTFFNIRPTYGRNGYNAAGSNNEWTLHEFCRGICLNPNMLAGQNRVVALVDSAKGIILGGNIKKSLGSGVAASAVQAGGTAIIWLDGVAVEPNAGATYDLDAGTTGAINYKRMSIAGLTTNGAVNPY